MDEYKFTPTDEDIEVEGEMEARYFSNYGEWAGSRYTNGDVFRAGFYRGMWVERKTTDALRCRVKMWQAAARHYRKGWKVVAEIASQVITGFANHGLARTRIEFPYDTVIGGLVARAERAEKRIGELEPTVVRFLDYWKRNRHNFQLEKAEDYFRQLDALLNPDTAVLVCGDCGATERFEDVCAKCGSDKVRGEG